MRRLFSTLGAHSEQEMTVVKKNDTMTQTRIATPVLSDRAMELGYECRPGLTPAWDIGIGKVRYDRPPEWLDAATWRRELRLWACDRAERALPKWEAWATENAPEHLDAPRRAIDVARAYALGEVDDTLDAARDAAGDAVTAARTACEPSRYVGQLQYTPESPAVVAARDAAMTAEWAAQAAAWSASDSARSASEAAFFAGAALDAERDWQREALARRLDQVAPWGPR